MFIILSYPIIIVDGDKWFVKLTWWNY